MSDIGKGTPFYHHVMGVKFRKPKPKPKGKKKKKIQKTSKPVRALLKVYASDTDLSQDSSGSGDRWLKINLKGLSKEKLDLLRKKIREIAKEKFEEVETTKRFQKFKNVAINFIEYKIKISRKYKDRIRQRINRWFKRLPETELTVLKAIPKNHIERKRRVIERNFGEIIEQYEQLVKEDKILPNPKYKDGTDFVFRHIEAQM